MKQTLLIFFIVLMMGISIFAQVNETVSDLTPYPNYIKTLQIAKEKEKNVSCIISSSSIETSPIDISVAVTPLQLSNGKQVAEITARTTNKNFAYADTDGRLQAQIGFFGRITSNNKRIDGVFEDNLVFDSNENEMKNFVSHEVLYRKLFDLPAGKYTIRFNIIDKASGAKGKQAIKFTVP